MTHSTKGPDAEMACFYAAEEEPMQLVDGCSPEAAAKEPGLFAQACAWIAVAAILLWILL